MLFKRLRGLARQERQKSAGSPIRVRLSPQGSRMSFEPRVVTPFPLTAQEESVCHPLMYFWEEAV